MSQKKTQSGEFSLRYLLLNPAVWFVLATSMLVFAATFLWDRHRDQLLEADQFQITKQRIEFNDPPNWFAIGLNDAWKNYLATERSLLDLNIVPKTRLFFEDLPWIREIEYIQKSAGGLDIQLAYRTPIAFVHSTKNKPIAIDGEGVVFDSTLFNSTELSLLKHELLHIHMPNLDLTHSIVWQTPMDNRIQQASRLSEFLAPTAKDLEFFRIVTYDLPTKSPVEQPQFQIWTEFGTRIVWGGTPGFESVHEAKASRKLTAIRQFVKQHGKLSEFKKKDQFELDVTSGTVVFVKATRVADAEHLSTALK